MTDQGKPRKGWFFNPYTQILLSILLATAAQLFMKKGADTSVPDLWMGIDGLSSGWVWLGIVAMVTGLFSWLYGLRFVPLNMAFNLAGLVQVLVPLAAGCCWGSGSARCGGAGSCWCCWGCYTVARPLMRVEEKL